MKIRIIATSFLLAFAFCLASITSADGVKKRITFMKGKNTAIVSGAVVRGDRDVYTVGAREGQRMSVGVTSTENNAVIQIKDSSGESLQNRNSESEYIEWSGELPATGDYEIIVSGTRGNATYKLSVYID